MQNTSEAEVRQEQNALDQLFLTLTYDCVKTYLFSHCVLFRALSCCSNLGTLFLTFYFIK